MSQNNVKQQRQLLLTQAKNDNPSSTPRVLVLVGIPGSGKSTFAEQLVQVGWKRVNQDDLGNRHACEAKMVEHLLEGENVVIDRCNFDKKQRKHWTDYAQYRGSRVGVIVFAVPVRICVERVRNRENHPTLAASEESDRVVHGMVSSLQFPNRSEGFDFCRVIRNDDDSDRVLLELLDNP